MRRSWPTYSRSPTVSQDGNCNGKRSYDQPTAAKMAKRTHRGTGSTVVPYRCPHCHRWHVGGSNGWVSGKRPRVEIEDEADIEFPVTR